MSNLTEPQPYNHDSESITEAMGVDPKKINEKWEEVYNSLPEQVSISIVSEALENNFSKREIAFIAARNIERVNTDPLSALLSRLNQD